MIFLSFSILCFVVCTPDIALTKVVFPCATWPIVPIFIVAWRLIISNVSGEISPFNVSNDWIESFGCFDKISLTSSGEGKISVFIVKNNIFSSNNGVLKKYDEILDEALQNIYDKSIKAVFVAISPSNTAKFLLKPEAIESIILDNIRQSDLLMNYAPNKYFLLLFNTDIDNASKIWNKIKTNLPEEIYAGFSAITNQKRQQLINEVLNKLHEAINNKVDITEQKIDSIESLFILP